MAYTFDIDWAPPYELLVSLQAYLDRSLHKTLELGPRWANWVKRRLGPGFATLVEEAKDSYPVGALFWQGGQGRDVDAFLDWLGGLTPGELYELAARDLPAGAPPIPKDLGARRDRLLDLLRAWNDGYFRRFNPGVLAGLKAEAEAKRAMLQRLPPEEVFEAATGGVVLQPSPAIRRVLLIPQYHARPWNLHDRLAWGPVYQYPAEVLAAQAGRPSPALLRLTRALSDESRLRILRYLARGPRTFTEIAKFSQLAKSTVHHHMMALRAAGLVRVHASFDAPDRYSLRPGALEQLGARLAGFFKE